MPKHFVHSDHIKWCCDRMKKYMHDDRYPLDLYLATRTYALPILWPHGGPDLAITYCPWCGTHLPNLMDKRSEILEKEYRIEYFDDPNIPEEFNSEEWWVKRGL